MSVIKLTICIVSSTMWLHLYSQVVRTDHNVFKMQQTGSVAISMGCTFSSYILIRWWNPDIVFWLVSTDIDCRNMASIIILVLIHHIMIVSAPISANHVRFIAPLVYYCYHVDDSRYTLFIHKISVYYYYVSDWVHI